MSDPSITAVVLAAGKGTRMKSNRAKVLHELFFKPMIHHVLDTVNRAGIEQVCVIVGHQREKVLKALADYHLTPVVQQEQLGTGHAVLCARQACRNSDLVMILCGDTPLIRPETLRAMIEQHRQTNGVLTLMTTRLEDPFGYGRVITDSAGHVLKIVEQKDATSEQRAIREINAGIYLVDREFLYGAIASLDSNNAQNEFYLTDIAAHAATSGTPAAAVLCADPMETAGVNSQQMLTLGKEQT